MPGRRRSIKKQWERRHEILGKLALTALVTCSLSTPVLAAGLDDIPADVRQRLYNPKMIDPAQPIGPSAYRDWKPKHGPPWTIGYASSYAGNTWRAAVMTTFTTISFPSGKSSVC